MRHIKDIAKTVLHCPECKEELEYHREDFEVFAHPSGTINQSIPAFYACSSCDWWIKASDVSE